MPSRIPSFRAIRRIFSLPSLKTLFFFVLSVGFFLVGALALWILTIDVPDFKSFEERRVVESSKIYDRTGEILLYSVQDTVKRTSVPLENISRFVKNATIAIEDAKFYQHIGVRPIAFLRAVLANITTGSFGQGGSTITQQVVKNTLLTPEKTLSRKLKEWVLAIKLEKILSKEEILAIYLNESPYGGNVYGVEEASLLFFGKQVGDVTLAEAAYLAALPQAPTYYSPYGNHRDALEERKNLVLKRMRELSYISEEEYAAALNEQVTFLPKDVFGIKAPHFVTWVMEYLAQKYGEDILLGGGLRVITSLDYELQKKAEEIVATYGKENEEKFNAHNAGMVGINPRTGEVLVMVGSRDYFDKEAEGNFNVTLARRQPGSSFKPFVYATAFMRGYTPDTVVFDLKTQFQTTCDSDGKPLYPNVNQDECYMPENYDLVYRGPVSLRDALAQSINIPAIKVLYLSGIRNAITTAQKMGITGLSDPDRYGLTLVLGGGEVSLLDLTSAYGVFANNGVRNPYQGVLRVEDKNGVVLEEFSPAGTEVIPKNIALQITDVLSDNEARAPAFGENSYLYFPGKDVAAKTGTTNDYRDAWIVGYTPSFALGAWVGNNDNTPMEKKVAGFIVAPLWNAFMKEVLVELGSEGEHFENPVYAYEGVKPVVRGLWRGGESYIIDKISGKLATEYTPEETREERVLTNVHSILYWLKKDDPFGQRPEHPEEDPQFLLWEKPVRSWAIAQGIVEDSSDIIPKQFDDVHTPDKSPRIQISSPADGSTFEAGSKTTIIFASTGVFPTTRADFFINDTLVGSSKTAPFMFSFVPADVGTVSPTGNVLRVVVYDSVYNKADASIRFDVSGL